MDNGRTNWKITPLGEEHIEAYLEIYLNAYPAYKSQDDACRAYYREKIRTDMGYGGDVTFTGLFEGDELIAIMKIVHFSMNLFGKMHPAEGLMSLGVHPLHKKKGAALAMVKFFEEYAKKAGAKVAILLPFNMGFYRKMGYGYGIKMDEYHIPTLSLPAGGDLSQVRLLTLSDLPKVLSCHEDFARANHGMVIKFGEEIREMEKDDAVKRAGVFDGERLKGYAAFRFISDHEENYTLNHIQVEELIYADGKVLRALLGFLRLQADLAQSVVIRSGEEDFYHLLDNPQDLSGHYMPFGYIQTNVSAVGTMYKIIDPAAFVRATDYRRFPVEDLTVKVICEDEMEGGKHTFSIAFEKDGEGTSRWTAFEDPTDSKDSADVTLQCKKADLSSLLMGACRLSSMVRMGSMDVSDSSYISRLDRLFVCEQKPWSNSDY